MLTSTYSPALEGMCLPALAGNQVLIPNRSTQVYPLDTEEYKGACNKPCLVQMAAGLGDSLCPLLKSTGTTFLPDSHHNFIAAFFLGIMKSSTRQAVLRTYRSADMGSHSSYHFASPSPGSAPPVASTLVHTHPP